MPGWMILFALLAAAGAAPNWPGEASKVTGSVFAFLFLLGLLTRAARGRAW